MPRRKPNNDGHNPKRLDPIDASLKLQYMRQMEKDASQVINALQRERARRRSRGATDAQSAETPTGGRPSEP